MGNSYNTCVLNQIARQCICWARNSVCRHPNKWAKVGSQRQQNLLWATKQNALYVFGPFDATQPPQRLRPGSQKKADGYQMRPIFCDNKWCVGLTPRPDSDAHDSRPFLMILMPNRVCHPSIHTSHFLSSLPCHFSFPDTATAHWSPPMEIYLVIPHLTWYHFSQYGNKFVRGHKMYVYIL
jgi:hypothetical protein